MKAVSPKRILLMSLALAGAVCAIVFQASISTAAEEGIVKMNSVVSPAKAPLLDAEAPPNLQTATFALG